MLGGGKCARESHSKFKEAYCQNNILLMKDSSEAKSLTIIRTDLVTI